jgi:hypothetical protein
MRRHMQPTNSSVCMNSRMYVRLCTCICVLHCVDGREMYALCMCVCAYISVNLIHELYFSRTWYMNVRNNGEQGYYHRSRHDSTTREVLICWRSPDSRFPYSYMIKSCVNQPKNWCTLCITTSLFDCRKFRMDHARLPERMPKNSRFPPRCLNAFAVRRPHPVQIWDFPLFGDH